jgi:nanoRNase/pAp phosphatase (c-di-AMP/oligoRNAs hydrolase)
VSADEPETGGSMESRPLLLVISEAEDLPAQVRSRDRQVCRWRPGRTGEGDGTFSGDPTRPACFEWVRDARAVTAVIDLEPAERAREAMAALRAVRPDAAVLLLSAADAVADARSDGTLARRGDLRRVLRLDLDEELERLEAERRVHCLQQFAAGDDVVPILIHDDPDPDAVSSAMAVVVLLGGSLDRTPIVTFGRSTRPENRRMAELLHVRITEITRAELGRFERVITVDTQPRGLQQDGRPAFAVIDHHPTERSYAAAFADIRPEYGATATIMTEYLRARQEERIGRTLATALLFGIRTDTDALTRGVTGADVDAYGFLQEHADLQLVRRLQRPSFPLGIARAFGAALRDADVDNDLCVACLGELDAEDVHVLADLADFCISIENVTWAVAAAEVAGELVLTLRHTGGGASAGTLARALADGGGSGGGHASMARVALPLELARERLAGKCEEGMAGGVRQLVREALDGLGATSRRG